MVNLKGTTVAIVSLFIIILFLSSVVLADITGQAEEVIKKQKKDRDAHHTAEYWSRNWWVPIVGWYYRLAWGDPDSIQERLVDLDGKHADQLENLQIELNRSFVNGTLTQTLYIRTELEVEDALEGVITEQHTINNTLVVKKEIEIEGGNKSHKLEAAKNKINETARNLVRVKEFLKRKNCTDLKIMNDVDDYLTKAREAFNAGNYPEAFAYAKVAKHSAERARMICSKIKEVKERYEEHIQSPLSIVSKANRELSELEAKVRRLNAHGIEVNVTTNITEIRNLIISANETIQNNSTEGVALVKEAKVLIENLEKHLEEFEESFEMEHLTVEKTEVETEDKEHESGQPTVAPKNVMNITSEIVVSKSTAEATSAE